MKKIYIFTVKSFLLLGAVSSSFVKPAAAAAEVGEELNDAQKRLGEELEKAIDRNNLGRVKELIAQGAPVNMKTQYGNTLLMESLNCDPKQFEINGPRGTARYYIIQALLAAGANASINTQNSAGITALMYATGKGGRGVSMVEELLAAGADVGIDAQDRLGDTALLRTVVRGRAGRTGLPIIVDEDNFPDGEALSLIRAGADINIKNKEGYSFFDIIKGFKNGWKKTEIMNAIEERHAAARQGVRGHLPPDLANLVVGGYMEPQEAGEAAGSANEEDETDE